MYYFQEHISAATFVTNKRFTAPSVAGTGGVLLKKLKRNRLQHRCVPVTFASFLRTPFPQNTSGRLLLHHFQTQDLLRLLPTDFFLYPFCENVNEIPEWKLFCFSRHFFISAGCHFIKHLTLGDLCFLKFVSFGTSYDILTLAAMFFKNNIFFLLVFVDASRKIAHEGNFVIRQQFVRPYKSWLKP